jgi:hypothetical protein
MALIFSNGLLTELKTTTQTTNLQFGDLVGKINISDSGGNGGGGGINTWYLYSDEGNINTGAPINPGNAIFTIQGSPVVETFNPNKADGVTYLIFNLFDDDGTDYTTEFTDLVDNGGTISIFQNTNKVTYTGVAGPSFFIDLAGFFVLSAQACTQTITATPFLYATPISITFGS